MKNGHFTPTGQQNSTVLGSVKTAKPNKIEALKQIQDALNCIAKNVSKNIYLF